MKILYIISQKRSGSKLIENSPGQHKQAISIGEFRMLKCHYLKEEPGELWNWKCNCGAEIKVTTSILTKNPSENTYNFKRRINFVSLKTIITIPVFY